MPYVLLILDNSLATEPEVKILGGLGIDTYISLPGWP